MLHYLQGTTKYILTNVLEIVSYFDSGFDFTKCIDDKKSILGTYSCYKKGQYHDGIVNNNSLLLRQWWRNTRHITISCVMLCYWKILMVSSRWLILLVPLKLYYDNNVCHISFSNNISFHTHELHLDSIQKHQWRKVISQNIPWTCFVNGLLK